MKRTKKQVTKTLHGVYRFYLTDLEDIASMLLEAYGSYALKIDYHELTFEEIPQLRQERAKEVHIIAFRKSNVTRMPMYGV